MPLKRILITVLVLLISFNCKSEGDDPREKIAVLHNDISPRDEAIQIIEESRSLNDPLEKQVTDKSSVPVTDPDTVNEMEGSVMATGSNVPDEIPMTEPKGTLTPAEIKNLIHKGRFSKILSYEINTASPLAKYYYGITYYCLAKAYPAGDGKRSSYASKAISILKEAAVDTDSRRLKAKAVLWHGIAMLVLKNKRFATASLLKPFKYIEQNLYNTRCYNDALFYIAQIYKIRGNKNAAEDYLDKLNKTSVRDRVYDVKHKKWVKPQTAYNHYMAQLTSKPRRTYDRPLDSLAKKIEEINNEIVGGRKKPDTGEAVFEQSSAPAAETTADEAEIEVQEDALDSALEEGSASSAGFDTGGVSSASSAASRSSASGQPETSSEGGDLDTEGESLDDEELDSVGNIDAEESSESSSAAEEETKEEKSDDSFDDEFVL